jgi:hypothetical protein
VKIHTVVYSVMSQYSVIGRYGYFRGEPSIHLQDRRLEQYFPPKRRFPSPRQHYVINHRTPIWISICFHGLIVSPQKYLRLLIYTESYRNSIILNGVSQFQTSIVQHFSSVAVCFTLQSFQLKWNVNNSKWTTKWDFYTPYRRLSESSSSDRLWCLLLSKTVYKQQLFWLLLSKSCLEFSVILVSRFVPTSSPLFYWQFPPIRDAGPLRVDIRSLCKSASRSTKINMLICLNKTGAITFKSKSPEWK